jgi:hypothetical protein
MQAAVYTMLLMKKPVKAAKEVESYLLYYPTPVMSWLSKQD